MRFRGRLSLVRSGFRLLAVACLPCTGCVSAWWNAWLDPTQVGNFRENLVNEIQQTITFEDKPSGIPAAVDPTPDDLVATVEEYEIGPGDVLSIRLLDFVALAVETVLEPLVVDELGYIDIPQLGLVRAEGFTPQELRAELIQQAKRARIYQQDSEPIVTVTVAMRQQRLFNLAGAIGRPDEYPIPRPDFRLRQALIMGGGLDETIKTIYVFRDEPRQTRIKKRATYATPPSPEGTGPEAPAPPVTPMTFSEAAGGPKPTSAEEQGEPQPTTRAGAGGGLALPGEEVESALKELEEVVAPGEAVGDKPEKTLPAASRAAPETSPALPPWVFVNDSWIESPPTPTQPVDQAVTPTPEKPSEPVDWQELAAEGRQRIIRIPADKLRTGDNNYNIVVRHRDWIQVDPGPVGYFYMGGHVMRPGPYALTGQQITLTQAIFSAGGLDPLAWPTRCEIRRRIDGDREQITQWDLARIIEGKDPDLFLKPHDVINVGTHAIAPFLATIRNSFRLAYGFGFVYDRNFADIDAVYGSANPRSVRRAEQAQRFPGLFP